MTADVHGAGESQGIRCTRKRDIKNMFLIITEKEQMCANSTDKTSMYSSEIKCENKWKRTSPSAVE